jgi:mono/diheme cytochrome c family protein
MERQVARLDDSSEFLLATRPAALFPQLQQKAQDMPALFHFLDGKSCAVCHGVDDCVEFFEEFVIANRCKRNNVKRY